MRPRRMTGVPLTFIPAHVAYPQLAYPQLQQTLATTLRTVRRAYWTAYATASLVVQRQSLTLAEESLRNTRTRVEVPAPPGIDIIEAEAEGGAAGR